MTARRAQSRQEAADWWAEIAEGGLRRRDRERFVDWLQESPENVAEYLELAAVWQNLGEAGADADVDAILARAGDADTVAHLPPLPAPREPDRRFRTPRRWLAAAAAFVAVGAALILLTPGDEPLRTAVGEQRSTTLHDGSVVTLNTRTTIKVRFGGDSRRVRLLEGEALFDVVPGRRPFVVDVDDVEVRALGTRFNVHRLGDSEARITVLAGTVAVQAPVPDGDRALGPGKGSHRELVLTDGQQVHIRPTETVAPVQAVAREQAAEWTARRITFVDTELKDVVAQFNRYSDDRLRVDNPELAALKLNGVFKTHGQDDLLEYLRKTEGIEVRRAGDERVITR